MYGAEPIDESFARIHKLKHLQIGQGDLNHLLGIEKSPYFSRRVASVVNVRIEDYAEACSVEMGLLLLINMYKSKA